MNNQEAIWWVNHLFEIRKEEYFNKGMMKDAKEVEQAQHMAIEALQKQTVYEQIKWERDMALQTLEEHGIGLGQKSDWIPVSKGYPKDLEEVNVTWVNHNPPAYYKHERDKPHTAVAVLYQGRWYWWDSTITDTLAEYGDRACSEPIDKDISITAWQPLPEPYKGGDE